MKNIIFKAEKISRTEVFELSGNIHDVFPLFGAFEERKWEPNWNPELIYPLEEIIEEGTTFKTQGREPEPEFLWRITKYDRDLCLIQYLVSTENRYWTITVQCSSTHPTEDKTCAAVTYTYYGLNEKGNALNKTDLTRMFKHNLQDWADAINEYLNRQETITQGRLRG